ncbi:MAG: two component transcriptional regulator, AraC family [Paenibacillaceae bacterium]|jgi:two-component system response regulator YesN|nr:two component transcriptional regulator, AraC family [Paenibacillaceae bacterium]
MYKVLIVDDEHFIRERLAAMIPWEEYDLKVEGLAEDGASALEMIGRISPDLVVSDIRMPDMTGLEMISRAKTLRPGIRFIILSAYGEFDYARQAIQLGVTDYLLKPTRPEELLQVLLKQVDVLVQQKQQLRRSRYYEESVRSQYMQELILGHHPGYDWQEECVNLGLEWMLKGEIRLLLITMEGHTDLDKSAQFAVQNVMYELLAECDGICPIRLSFGKWLLAAGGYSSEEELLGLARHLYDGVERFAKQKLHIMISEAGQSPLELSRLFWETEKMMEYMGEDAEAPIRFQHPSSHELAYAKWTKPMAELIEWMKKGETEQVARWLNQLGPSLLEWELGAARRWCFEWLTTIREHVHPDGESVLPDTEDLKMRIAGQSKNKNLLQFFTHELHYLIQQRHGKGAHRLVRIVLERIGKEYGQDIQLTIVAEELGISPVYLSELIKQQTGITFRAHLLQARMTAALRLLKDPTLKVYEVSYKVGYNKVEHFVKLFKKEYGMTPSEYRGALV